jgi:hypothetical protein
LSLDMPTLSPIDRGRLRHAAALAQRHFGDQSGQNAPLERAVFGFQNAIADFEGGSANDEAASSYNSLGNALKALGEREPEFQREVQHPSTGMIPVGC